MYFTYSEMKKSTTLATMMSPPPRLKAMVGPPTLRLRGTQKSHHHRSTLSTIHKLLEHQLCELKHTTRLQMFIGCFSVPRLCNILMCAPMLSVFVGIIQSSTPPMQPPPLRAHISLVPVHRATTRWRPHLLVTRTHILLPATIQRRLLWPIRCVTVMSLRPILHPPINV